MMFICFIICFPEKQIVAVVLRDGGQPGLRMRTALRRSKFCLPRFPLVLLRNLRLRCRIVGQFASFFKRVSQAVVQHPVVSIPRRSVQKQPELSAASSMHWSLRPQRTGSGFSYVGQECSGWRR